MKKNLLSTEDLAKSFELLKQGKSCAISENISISLINKNDFNDIVTMLNSAKVNKYLFYAPATAEVFEGFFTPLIKDAEQSILKKEWPNAAGIVIRDHEHNFIGNAGLIQNPFLVGNFEIGYHISEKAWGKGVATLVSDFLTNIAFSHLGAYKISADCYAKNIGSIKVLEKSGYKNEGCLKEYYNKEDDKMIFGITKAQFLDSKK